MLKIHPIKARVNSQAHKALGSKDVILFILAMLYAFTSTAFVYAPPLLGLFMYLLLNKIRHKQFDWAAFSLAVFLCVNELLHGFYLFACLLSIASVFFTICKRLPYKLRQIEFVICAWVIALYVNMLLINLFFDYINDVAFNLPSPLFIYYAAIECFIACVFFKDNL